MKHFKVNTSYYVNPIIDLQQPCVYNVPVNLKDFISYFFCMKMPLPLLVQTLGVYPPSPSVLSVILVLKAFFVQSSHILVCKLMLLQEFQ